jgi:hypothetical protein
MNYKSWLDKTNNLKRGLIHKEENKMKLDINR